MGSLNQVTLCGRLGADPELKTTPSGKQVCTFSVATDDGTKDVKRTSWHRITCWEKTAEVAAKFLTKGREVLITGRIQYSESEKDGVKKYWTDIIAERVVFLSSGKDVAKDVETNDGEV